MKVRYPCLNREDAIERVHWIVGAYKPFGLVWECCKAQLKLLQTGIGHQCRFAKLTIIRQGRPCRLTEALQA